MIQFLFLKDSERVKDSARQSWHRLIYGNMSCYSNSELETRHSKFEFNIQHRMPSPHIRLYTKEQKTNNLTIQRYIARLSPTTKNSKHPHSQFISPVPAFSRVSSSSGRRLTMYTSLSRGPHNCWHRTTCTSHLSLGDKPHFGHSSTSNLRPNIWFSGRRTQCSPF